MDLLFRLAEEGAFALVARILMIRSGGDGAQGNLTQPAWRDWRQKNLDNVIGILRRSLDRHRQDRFGKALRLRLVQLLSYRAKLHVAAGESRAARRLCRDALAQGVWSREAAICAAGFALPALLKRARA